MMEMNLIIQNITGLKITSLSILSKPSTHLDSNKIEKANRKARMKDTLKTSLLQKNQKFYLKN